MKSLHFLSTKTKNSPAFNIIKAKTNQKQSHLTNNIYSYLKQQTQKKRNQQAQNEQFQSQLQHKLSQQPGRVIATYLSKGNNNKYQNNKFKTHRNHSLSPKKRYQLQTKASVSKKQRRTKSMLIQFNQNDYLSSKYIIRTQTINPNYNMKASHSTINNQSIPYHNFILKQNKAKNKNKSRKLSRTFSYISGANHYQHSQPSYIQQSCETQLEYYNELICGIRKSSKKFQQSMISTQKRFDMVDELNNKMQDHFSNLILDEKQFPDLQFDNMDNLTKADRYKFSSNHILQNLLSKNDKQVQEWIQIQKNRLLRKKGANVVKQTINNEYVFTDKRIRMINKLNNMNNITTIMNNLGDNSNLVTNTNKNNDNNQQIDIQIKDIKLRKFLQNPQHQINKLKQQTNIILSNNFITINNHHNQHNHNRSHHHHKGDHNIGNSQNNKIDNIQIKKMSMTAYGKNYKQIKQYEKKKFMSKTIYQPKRSKNTILIV